VEEWNNPAFARAWAEENPAINSSRRQHLDLLLAILADHLNMAQVPRRVLDVGCGHGVVAERVLREIEGTTLVGVDGSPPMLEMARETLAPFEERARLIHEDFETMAPEALTGGPFGAAIAVQAIHNCSDEGKQKTLASVRTVLAPGGLFLLMDRMRLATPALFGVYHTIWQMVGAAFNTQQLEGESFVEHERSVRERGDKPGSVEQNLLWLREAGFREVAPVQVVGIRALIAAVR